MVLLLVVMLIFFALVNGRNVGPAEVMMAGSGSVFGILAGLVLYVFGILISAQGQILQATLDSAVNSSPFLTDEMRAEMMSLR
jgi:hypothetical protein